MAKPRSFAMPDVKPFSLLEVKDPRFTVELPDKTVKSYDPWETVEKLQQVPANPNGSVFNFEEMRKAFGFPTAAEADTSGEFTPSRNALIEMSAALHVFIDNLEVSKKLAGLSRKS
jgi:hypothetical protein